ncbi:hypothetical protein C8J57DRAFT_1458304 [Mycena rebaudengoi]|nr:hypothetical protein C8J57DRAFT_1458304 [Mycena rebaudengoi]
MPRAIFSTTLAFVLLATVSGVFAAGPAPVLLGTAKNFAILAKTGVSTVPNSAVSGNVGISPATVTSLTGFSLVRDVSQQFWTSTQTPLPFPDRPRPNFVGLKAGLIGGSILVPGLYKWTTGVTISTGITISGGPGDRTLVQSANVRITLIGGAQSRNIVWVVAGTVSIGTNAVFEGNILAKTNVVVGTNAIDHGCIYAQTAVTLQKATVSCSGGGVAPPPTSSPASSLPPTSAPVSTTPPPTMSPSPTSSTPTTTYSAKCTPTAAPCYSTAFENLEASIHGDDYLTYILTDTVDAFALAGLAARSQTPITTITPRSRRIFLHMLNTTMLTCAIYAGCHTAADATNTGGQTEPDGGVSAVTNSSGYCLKACGYGY